LVFFQSISDYGPGSLCTSQQEVANAAKQACSISPQEEPGH